VTDAGLRELGGLVDLRVLVLAHTRVTDAGLRELGGLKGLQVLNLFGTAVTDAGLRELGGLVDLRVLVLAHTRVTDAGLRELGGLKGLQTLSLDGTVVRDAGLKELRSLRGLQMLYVRSANTTENGRSNLQAALPNLQIFGPTRDKGKAALSKELGSGSVQLPKDTRPDVRFVFDFKALNFNSGDARKDAALRTACDSFVKTTRDQVYPILRDITGVYVGKRHKEIRYTILTGPPGKEAGGTTTLIGTGFQIKLDQRYSVMIDPPQDVHELIHVFNAASGVLRGDDDHIWHGALMNAVEVRLGLPPRPSRSDTMKELERLLATIEASPGDRRNAYELRCGILGDQIARLYFDLGEKAIGRLYRSNINPHPVHKPNRRLVEAWNGEGEAVKVEALLETLKQDYNFTFDKRTRSACGFP
jgi:hypothetical protein